MVSEQKIVSTEEFEEYKKSLIAKTKRTKEDIEHHHGKGNFHHIHYSKLLIGLELGIYDKNIMTTLEHKKANGNY